jgi:hypothetical protein
MKASFWGKAEDGYVRSGRDSLKAIKDSYEALALHEVQNVWIKCRSRISQPDVFDKRMLMQTQGKSSL